MKPSKRYKINNYQPHSHSVNAFTSYFSLKNLRIKEKWKFPFSSFFFSFFFARGVRNEFAGWIWIWQGESNNQQEFENEWSSGFLFLSLFLLVFQVMLRHRQSSKAPSLPHSFFLLKKDPFSFFLTWVYATRTWEEGWGKKIASMLRDLTRCLSWSHRHCQRLKNFNTLHSFLFGCLHEWQRRHVKTSGSSSYF